MTSLIGCMKNRINMHLEKDKILFISKNKGKISEAQQILGNYISIIPQEFDIAEIQTEDFNTLVKDKVLKAYRRFMQPLFIEHTGLQIDSINGLPGGLTQIFWDKLEADKFSELFNGDRVRAVTTIGYTDGKSIKYFKGEILGTIVSPRGSRDFQWDCIFEPIGYDKTFSELQNKKNDISMRKIALEKFREYIKETYD